MLVELSIMPLAATEGQGVADEAAIRAIPLQMIDGWNKGSGEAFAAP